MDLLSNILKTFHLQAYIFFHAHLHGTWAVDNREQRHVSFHIVAKGSCWLHFPELDIKPIWLAARDLVVLPQGAAYILSNDKVCPSRTFVLNTTENIEAEEVTTLICGRFSLLKQTKNPLLSVLPDVIHVPYDRTYTLWLNDLINLLIFEKQSPDLGTEIIINQLATALFSYVIRYYILLEQPTRGLLAAIQDNSIYKALQAIHQQPEIEWTVEKLAQLAYISRSQFAARFQEVMGITPIQYLYNWRMEKAYELLKTTQLSILDIAEQCGYTSEAAFSKVFKRYTGINPGVVRKNSK